MKKIIVAIVIAIIVLAGGAYAIFHSSSKPATGNSSPPASQSNTPMVNNAVLTTKTDSQVGAYLADPSGKPLYTYNADTKNVSNCTGSCLANWPAYVAKGSTSNLPTGVGTIKRSDNGQIQYTYNGVPLYYFTGDSAGHVTGNGVENFSIAKPAAASTSSSSTSSSSSSQPTRSSNPYSGPAYNY